jgi:hypothetical protein
MLTLSKSAELVLVLRAGLLSLSDRDVDCERDGMVRKWKVTKQGSVVGRVLHAG